MHRTVVSTPMAALALFFLVLPPTKGTGVDAREQVQDRELLMSGSWQGTWLSLFEESRGFEFSADLQLKVAADNTVKGQIHWTLEKSPATSPLADFIGFTAIESVKGTYDSKSRTLSLDGYAKDDHAQIIALDRYRLILAENNQMIGGITQGHGGWQGLISLKLKKSKKSVVS